MRRAALVVVLFGLLHPPWRTHRLRRLNVGHKCMLESKCSMCHSVAGKGNAKGVLDDVGAKLSADEIRQWLVDPAAMTREGTRRTQASMKSYASLPKGRPRRAGGLPADAESKEVTGDARSIRSKGVSRQPSWCRLRLHDHGDGVSRVAFSDSAGERRAGDTERRRGCRHRR